MYVAVDILERAGPGLRLIEVKSSVSVKEHHIPDVAVQAHVVRQSGVDLAGTEVMHLNRACAYPDLSNLFVRSDVTGAVGVMAERVPDWIAAQLDMLRGPLPDVPVGHHCEAPYECPFVARCWPVLPAHHVSTLYAMRRRALEFDEQGYRTIHDLPEDVPLGKVADRQRRAVQEGRIIVEPGLARALEVFVPPIAFLDFETVGLAVPVWEGCHPYDAVPVQFSCHVQDQDGRVTHHQWLADGPEDPRPALAERVVAACAGTRGVVAYNASFERACLRHLATAIPGLEEPLTDIANRLIDLLPVVRNNIYHPDFDGSFSLKRVLPALFPELGYSALPIADGGSASLELDRLLFHRETLDSGTREKLRGDLLRYCRHDSWGLAKLLARLSRLTGATGASV